MHQHHCYTIVTQTANPPHGPAVTSSEQTLITSREFRLACRRICYMSSNASTDFPRYNTPHWFSSQHKHISKVWRAQLKQTHTLTRQARLACSFFLARLHLPIHALVHAQILSSYELLIPLCHSHHIIPNAWCARKYARPGFK